MYCDAVFKRAFAFSLSMPSMAVSSSTDALANSEMRVNPLCCSASMIPLSISSRVSIPARFRLAIPVLICPVLVTLTAPLLPPSPPFPPMLKAPLNPSLPLAAMLKPPDPPPPPMLWAKMPWASAPSVVMSDWLFTRTAPPELPSPPSPPMPMDMETPGPTEPDTAKPP